MNNHSVIAIDLAKSVFQVCIISANNRVLMNKSFNRKGLTEFMLKQPGSIVAMEACYSSHYWGRLFESFGHQVKLLSAQHVKPFVGRSASYQYFKDLHNVIRNEQLI